MVSRVILAAFLLAFSKAAAATPLELWVDPDGTTFLHNTTSAPISFDGYQIASESGRLDPTGWTSIRDYHDVGGGVDISLPLGAGGYTFAEANPSASNLAELNLGGFGTLQPGASFSIGKPFLDHVDPGGAADFFWKQPDSIESRQGDIVVIPEPSAFVLAVLAGLGLLAVPRRKAGKAARAVAAVVAAANEQKGTDLLREVMQ